MTGPRIDSSRRRLLKLGSALSVPLLAGCSDRSSSAGSTSSTASGRLEVTGISATPNPVRQAHATTITIAVANLGESSVSDTVEITVDGSTVLSDSVEVSAGGRATIETQYETGVPGRHQIRAGGATQELRVDPYPTDFVQVDGTDFVIDGDPVYLSGANNPSLVMGWSSKTVIDDVLDDAASLGLSVLRTWAYCAGDGGNVCFQPQPGEFDETAFELLDYVIYAAKRNHVRLILPLVNNWDVGMGTYAEWSETATDHDDFYTDENARRMYERYVEHMLTRVNTLTGVAYRDDPTILMWELANEPRFYGDDLTPMQAWIADMATYVKSIDQNHLVSTGSEGSYRADRDGADSDFPTDHEPSAIDACSFHMYPGYFGDGADVGSAGAEWIRRHTNTAHENLGKPAYLGEFGTWVRPDPPNRKRIWTGVGASSNSGTPPSSKATRTVPSFTT